MRFETPRGILTSLVVVVVLVLSVSGLVDAASAEDGVAAGADEAGFVDIGGNPHEENIRFIVNRGLTVGCDLEGPRYCPDDPVTRAQMATFLSRALRLDTSAPHMGVFPDVADGTWYAPHVEGLGVYGLSDTQVSDSYRPDDLMLRSEMAVFLQKTFRLSPSVGEASFGDVPSDTAYAREVEAVLEAGITRGCSADPLLYCPDDTVKRDTMASFLARAIRFTEQRQLQSLAPGREILASASLGEHTWDVWVCEGTPLDEGDPVEFLNREIGPYYEWLSGGAYQIRFRPGADPFPQVTRVLENCDNDSHMHGFPPEGNNVFIGGRLAFGAGAASRWFDHQTNRYDRVVWSDRLGVYDSVLYAHEIGHTFGWPHNFPERSSSPLNTGMDIMASRDQVVGTNAHNLFHVGWINPDHVAVHSEGEAVYTIAPPHSGADTSLVMMPLSPTRLLSVGVRVREGFDRNIAKQGVEVYDIRFCRRLHSLVGCKDVHTPPGIRSGDALVLGVGDSWTGAVTKDTDSGRPLTAEITVSVTGHRDGLYTVNMEETVVSAPLSTLEVGRAGVCGLLADQTVTCWEWWGGEPTPDHDFTSVGVGARVCGTRPDGSIECWGPSSYGTSPPEGQFSTVSVSGYHGCGLREDGTVQCWGADHNRRPITNSPEEKFTAITVGWSHGCGLRADQTVGCWGTNDHGEASPPEGKFVSVTAGRFFTCGLRPDHTIECWGDSRNGKTTPPAGGYAHAEAGRNHACAIRYDGAVVCWGNNTNDESSPPLGVFTAISAGDTRTCGLRPDLTVECWGKNGS